MSDDNPVLKQVEDFNKRSLKKTCTAEKNRLPSKEEIEAEKKEQEKGKK